jgi:hypothetical protein
MECWCSCCVPALDTHGAAREGLAEDNHVGLGVVPPRGELLARPAAPSLNLILKEERAQRVRIWVPGFGFQGSRWGSCCAQSEPHPEKRGRTPRSQGELDDAAPLHQCWNVAHWNARGLVREGEPYRNGKHLLHKPSTQKPSTLGPNLNPTLLAGPYRDEKHIVLLADLVCLLQVALVRDDNPSLALNGDSGFRIHGFRV